MIPATRILSESKRRLLALRLQGVHERDDSLRPLGLLRAPLSHEQELIWLHAQSAPDLPLYNEILTVHRRGPLEVRLLERALTELLRRHQAWRTTFELDDGAPIQLVHPPPEVELPVTDLAALAPPERDAEARRIAGEEAQRPLDLARGPLVRFRLLRLADDEHRLHITLHQILHDGVSVYSVLLPELSALYEELAAGRPSQLQEPSIQYADFAAWQRTRDRVSAASLDWWREELADAPAALELPADRARPPAQSFRGHQLAFALPLELTEAVKKLARREGVTLFVALLAAFEVMLHRYTGEEDLLLGTALSTRRRSELDGLLGVFLNTVVLRARLDEALPFRALLTRVREATVNALSHGDVPFQRLVKELAPRRDPARAPLVQATFVLEPPMPAPLPGWSLTQMDADTGVCRADLYLQLDDRPEGLVGHLRCNEDVWVPETARAFAAQFRRLVESIVRDPGLPIGELDLLGPETREPADAHARPDSAFERFEAAALEQSLQRRFAEMVSRHPRNIAVRATDRRWTYAELNQAANQVAQALEGLAGKRVALLVEHGAAIAVGIFGILKAGAAYVPLDPSHPRERLQQIVSDAGVSALVCGETHRALADSLTLDGPVIDLDAAQREPNAPEVCAETSPDALAYLIYTSGSSGRPKGVAQTHRNALHFIAAYTNALHLCADDRLSLFASAAVDAAVMDVFGALSNGAALCPIDVRGEGLGGVRARLRRDRITVLHATPTLFRHVAAALEEGPRPAWVRLVVLGGEEALASDAELCRERFPRHCVLVNGFGPTESTVALQRFIARDESLARRSLPLGVPVERTRVSLLSRGGRAGQVFGEIALESAHLAPGYWRDEEASARAFVTRPGGARVYRTGDLGRLLPDGSIEFRGRRDLQIKLHGFRVELAEIESALAACPGVAQAAAGVVGPEPRLVAWWVSSTDPAPDTERLRQHLRDRLPRHMVPAAFVRLDALPLTASGKLDRRELPAPRAPEPRVEPAAPESDEEALLVELWKRVLGLETVGVRDDFFDLGGHSLSALQLMAEIEAHTSVRLPLSALAEDPTIERLAQRLRVGPTPGRALVALQPAGDRPPLFCVHGHFGEVLFYRELAHALGPNQPFFGLQAQALAGRAAHESLPAMAADYLGEIRSVQRNGPYLIGGYCLGALVAFEMAQQLAARGEKVALLALFWGRSHKPALRERLRFHRAQLRTRGTLEKAAYLLGKARDNAITAQTRSQLWQLAWHLNAGGDRARELAQNVPEITLQAARSYVPQRYPGRMTVFLSGGSNAPSASADELAGMSADELELIAVPGDRDSMLRAPFVDALAAHLKRELARAADGFEPPRAEPEDAEG